MTIQDRLNELIDVKPEFEGNWSGDYDRGSKDHASEQTNIMPALAEKILEDLEGLLLNSDSPITGLAELTDSPISPPPYQWGLSKEEIRQALRQYCLPDKDRKDG